MAFCRDCVLFIGLTSQLDPAADPLWCFDYSLVPVVESAEPEPANRPPVAAAEETPPPDLPATENSHGTVNHLLHRNHCSGSRVGH